MNEQKETVKTVANSNEIDILDLLKKLWFGRRTIFIGIGVGAVLGLIIAFTTPKGYKVVTTMLPQSGSESSMSSISSLASLAGFDLNIDASSDITPVVYPQIVESVPFMLEILNSKYTFSDVDHPVSMYDYFTKFVKPSISGTIVKYTLGLPSLIKKSLIKKEIVTVADSSSKGNITYLTEKQNVLIESLSNQIILTVNKKEGFLTLTCTFHEALLTAQVAAKAQELLQKTITAYKTKKSSEQLDFIQQRFNDKRNDYINIQNKLAGYRDRNLNVFTASAGTEQERLQNEYTIVYSVYSELAKQLEQAKIQVKNQTPVFAVIKPVVVPLIPYAPRKSMILLVWLFLGGFAGVGIVVGKEYIGIFKKILSKKKA